MDICRACGQLPDDYNKFSESLQKYSDIYFNLTSIKLTPDEDPNRQRICDNCHLKLLEYNRFRTVCLQVHYKLAEIKKEVPDHLEYSTVECKPVIQTFKTEGADESGVVPPEEFNDGLPVVKETQDSDNESPVQVVFSDADEDSDSDYDKPLKPKRKPRIKNKDGTREKVYDCSQCSKKFRSEMRYQGHLRVHQGLKPALCTYCGKDFMKYNNLKLHISQKHSDDQTKFPCDFPGCELAYATKQGMKNHRKRHDPNFISPEPKRCVCDQCGKTFSTTGALKKHGYIHTGDMPFQCTICNKRLPTAHKLKEHTMRHEGVKNHVCPYCGQKKTTRHELKVHMNYHTREKQFTCHVCAQVFSNIGNMSRHIKIVHCGIKAYPCSYCDRSFGKAETLKHHVMTHTGEKPHECKVCGKRFIQQVALHKHMKTHRKHQNLADSSLQQIQLHSSKLVETTIASAPGMIVPQQLHLQQSPVASSDCL